MSASVSPTVFISWAHSNPDWKPGQEDAWRKSVGSFAHVLVEDGGIDADIDIWHDTDSVEWTRWGPQKIKSSDRVIVVVSQAWTDRFEAVNDPTIGAGAVAEADMLLGLFNENQALFRQKVMLVLLNGVQDSEIPTQLQGVSRFRIKEHSLAGIDSLLRYLTGQPQYLRPVLGAIPVLSTTSLKSPPLVPTSSGADKIQSEDEASGAAAATATTGAARARETISIIGDGNSVQLGDQQIHNSYSSTGAASSYEVATRAEYLTSLRTASDARLRYRRRGVGLNDNQVERSLAIRAHVPAELVGFPQGQLRVLTGQLGTGKSDVAEEWHRANISQADRDPKAAVPVWISIDDLDVPLERAITEEVGRLILAQGGVDVVIDGLDERTDRAANALRQATDLVAKRPNSRVLLTSRTQAGASIDTVVEVPPLNRGEAARIIRAVAPRTDIPVSKQLDESLLQRPLFALLVGQYASDISGTTGIPELIDLVVGSVVEADAYDLYDDLKRLAVETIRIGRPVDPTMFTTADIAAQLIKSPLVTPSGKVCSFSLATFEQWFASKAMLEDEIDVDELLSSLQSFDRWKYVFAIVLAAGQPRRVDPIMSKLAEWNPGAAAWVIQETHSGGLSRTRPDAHPGDWEEIGMRLRSATRAWLTGLRPLAAAFSMFSIGNAHHFDETSLAVDLTGDRLHTTWMMSSNGSDVPLPPVVQNLPLGSDGRFDRAMVGRSGSIPTGLNWTWEKAQADLANDLDDRLTALVSAAAASCPGVAAAEMREETHIRTAFSLAGPGTAGGKTASLYPGPDGPGTSQEPWGTYSIDQMRRRVEAILGAAMDCYLELAEVLAPQFGITLAHKGLMPVEYYAVMFYDPEKERSSFSFPGPREPGIKWLLKPLGGVSGPSATENIVSLTVNDDVRAEEIDDERDALYREFRRYVEANPVYEPFAGDFQTTSGRLEVHSAKPATAIATRWLWNDLKRLGFVHKTAPR